MYRSLILIFIGFIGFKEVLFKTDEMNQGAELTFSYIRTKIKL